MAFGTSVAGVAASAMLGLVATLSRRERMLATRQLDTRTAGVFRGFSLAHQRQETYKALQMQADALPLVAEKLEAMTQNLGRMGDTLGDKLIANQNLFHESVKSAYSELASSVEQSLTRSLAESGRLAGESIKPLLRESMDSISQEAKNTHQQLTLTAQEQLETLSGRFIDTTEEITTALRAGDEERLSQWSDAMHRAQEKSNGQMLDASRAITGELQQVGATQQTSFAAATKDLESLSAALVTQWEQVGAAQQASFTTTTQNLESLCAALVTQWEQVGTGQQASFASATQDLESLSAALVAQWQQAGERMAGLETNVAEHLATLGKELEEPLTRLIQTAAETPRAAAEVIGQLREEISNNIERDTLSSSLEQASAGQREAIGGLVKSSSDMLADVGSKFSEHVGAELAKMSGVAENFAGSAVQMSSLGDAFGLAVNLFNESNGKLIENLARIEESMDNSAVRSDEQMNYYVAQAREIIDQSMLSHKEVFEELQQLGSSKEAFEAVVRKYMKEAYFIALGLVGNRDDALDLSQEAFVRAYTNLHRFDPNRSFFPWFYQILRNLCFSHLLPARCSSILRWWPRRTRPANDCGMR